MTWRESRTLYDAALPSFFFSPTRRFLAMNPTPEPHPAVVAALNAAHEVWLVTAGAGKAAAVKLALGGAGPVEIPAAGVHGRQRTLWLLDEAAASQLPRSLSRAASP